MTTALLPRELTGATLEVSIAWGAAVTDLTGSSWTWTDVTADVRQAPGINITMGRSDEAQVTQPASLTLTLDNATGKYSLGPQSSNYPNVRRGVPVRVRVVPSTGAAAVTVFQGEAVSWSPDWALRGSNATVALEASGALRRLAQGSTPVDSPMLRFYQGRAGVVNYWPMEDGTKATQFLPVTGTTATTWSGVAPKLASDSTFAASEPLPTLSGTRVDAIVPAYVPASDSSCSVRLLVNLPAASSAPADSTSLLRVFCTGSTARFDVRYRTGGNLEIVAYDFQNNVLLTSGAVGFNVDASPALYSLDLYQNGSNVAFELYKMTVGSVGPGYYKQSTAGTLGLIYRVEVNPDGAATNMVAGHLAVTKTRWNSDPISSAINQLNGYLNENAPDRITRVCAENSIPLTTYNDNTGGGTFSAEQMDTQTLSTPLALLRDAELTGRGLLFDGLGPGLSYRTKFGTENTTPVLTTSTLAVGFDVVDDDQRLVNKAVVSRANGSTQIAEDVSGPLGTAVVRTYDVAVTASVNTDAAAMSQANWLVGRGTTVGYRYPQVNVNLRATPGLAAAWLAVIPGTRIDVTGLDATLPGHPAGTRRLLVEGVSNSFMEGEWVGVAKCSPFDPWSVATVGPAATGNDGDFVLALDGESTTSAVVTPTTTSVTVTTAAGLPVWTTATTNFPLQASIGGFQVQVNAVTGTTSPQTFSITAPGVSIPSGAAVRLWQPKLLGL